MGKRAEVGTPKHLANAMKSKGLQRLRWYCQVCEKQCRDENGFKCHTQSEGHLRQMLVVGESAGRHIQDYSMQFQHDFVALLSRSCGTQRVKANNIYQDYIRDKQHMHMNATRWVTLTEFVKHLGRSGIVRVEETEKGLFINWIDNSPMALSKAEANMKKERLSKSDEQRERQLISEQIERATELQGGGSDDGDEEQVAAAPLELIKPEGEKFKFSLQMKKPLAPSPPADSSAPSSSIPTSQPTKAEETPPPIPVASIPKPAPINPFKMAALKNSAKPSVGNVFKSAGPGPSLAGTKRPMSATELLMVEDMERKRRRMDREAIRPTA